MTQAHRLDDSARLCAHLLQTRAVYAPQLEDGEARWHRLEQPAALPADSLRPLFSPKQFFFAEREPLFAFDGKRFVPTLPEPSPQALFGVSACDLAAIAYQDRFFADDPYYRLRRAATLLVGVDCQAPCSGAFCHAMDAGPSVQPGTADLILHREPGHASAILVAETPLGEAALAGLSLLPPPSAWQARRRAGAAHAKELFADDRDVHTGIARLNQGRVDAQTWDQLGLQCVGCSGCTTVCPTCSCFAARDEAAEGGVAFTRSRFWDSCLLEGFAREASGQHPAGAPGQRVERFWYHKLSDDFRASFGRYGCVGCGRCDTACPGVIGARSVLRRLAQA
jgi:sulfhydrogenase subunit beta (sulfur reductase)